MTITARYPGRCATCGGRIVPGQEIEWDKSTRLTRHSSCAVGKGAPATAGAPSQPIGVVSGGARHERGRNRKPGYCERCNTRLAPGEGHLQYCVEDSGCLKHHDYSGYHLYCADTEACQQRRAEAKAKAEAERKARIEASLTALRSLQEPIRVWYHDGEYLSGYQVSGPAAEHMATLGLARYVSMWGYHVDHRVVEVLGAEFTGAQVAEYMRG